MIDHVIAPDAHEVDADTRMPVVPGVEPVLPQLTAPDVLQERVVSLCRDNPAGSVRGHPIRTPAQPQRPLPATYYAMYFPIQIWCADTSQNM